MFEVIGFKAPRAKKVTLRDGVYIAEPGEYDAKVLAWAEDYDSAASKSEALAAQGYWGSVWGGLPRIWSYRLQAYVKAWVAVAKVNPNYPPQVVGTSDNSEELEPIVKEWESVGVWAWVYQTRNTL